ncbi:GalNAc(5)-diNAcBac-PP-undecaprenol beta-1,3-glucosyltransferase [Gemmata sp. SH-PL17]|nr:GalNAc(5)-diNAcBac-PP-undecaprenol beta-1,3-glucosyltransferase [Gemmata sp. SH-PL17]
MSAVKFSVVIPTRERAETLRFALRTCLDQTFDDYEIIVSDNFSSPATKAVVDECGSPKVRYVRTSEPVAMSTNWEFGLSHTRGEYVLLIGDDDGLLPHALTELDRLSREPGARVIRWSPIYYTWPNVALPGQGDYIEMSFGCTLRHRDGRTVIREVAAFREFYTALPMLYNAAVHRDVLATLRARAGRVFPHPVPDVYSGFSIAHAAERFLSTAVPMSVSGQSAASNGIATLFNRGRNAIDREFHALNARDGLRSEPTVPDLPVYPHVPVADAFAFAKRTLFPDLDADLDRRALARVCVTNARVSRDDWPAALVAIRDSFADDPESQKWFDAELAATLYTPPARVQLRPERLGFDGRLLHLDAAAFGVSDVAGAAQLCAHLLNYRDQPVQYSHSEDDRHIAAMKIADLAHVCNERERAILRVHLSSTDLIQTVHRLQGVCDEREKIILRADAQTRELNRQLREERRWSLKRPLLAAKRLLTRAIGRVPVPKV